MTQLRRVLAIALVAACGESDPCDVPGNICTIVGTGERGHAGDDGPALDAEMSVPQDVAISPEGELWVLDFNNYQVRAVDKDQIIRTVVGTGEVGDDPDPGVPAISALDASFNHTTSLFFADGYLYVSAWHSSRVKRVRLADMMLENYAGRGRRTFYDGDGGPALDASLDLPSSIARDPNGNIVIMDQANQVIRRINSDGTITRIAGSCVVDYDVPCSPGQTPVACPGSNKTTCGDPATECGKPCAMAYGGDGGLATNARLAQPWGQQADPAGRIVYDPTGNLLFADTDNNRIRKVDAAGIITTIAGTGTAGYSGEGLLATGSDINRPVDVEIGPGGDVYFTDVMNSCVRRIDSAGLLWTVAGQCSPFVEDRGFGGDGGPALQARMDRPYGIHLDGKKLYISDSYNDRIRLVNLP